LSLINSCIGELADQKFIHQGYLGVSRLLVIFFGLAAWWLIVPLERYLAADGWRLISAGLPIFAASICLLVACFSFRKNDLVVLLWSPLFVLSIWFLGVLTTGLSGELQAPGGGEPAPLEGAAMLLLMAIWVAALIVFIGCLFCFPRKISLGLLGASLINSASIFFIIYSAAEVEARQMVTVRVLDKFDKPVAGQR
jgi:hypothetical protein